MNFEELLKKYLGEDKVAQFLADMTTNKLYLTKEENINKRYSKLKSDLTAKEAEHQQALDLIEQLKASGSQEMQTKIADYEATITKLKNQNKELAKENALKVALLSNKAKADDIDYLLFKLSKDENAVKVNENGEITNVKEIIESMKTSYPSHFDGSVKKKVEVQKLPGDDDDKDTITKEQFDKMGYQEKNKLFKENKDLYDKLSGKGDE